MSHPFRQPEHPEEASVVMHLHEKRQKKRSLKVSNLACFLPSMQSIVGGGCHIVSFRKLTKTAYDRTNSDLI